MSHVAIMKVEGGACVKLARFETLEEAEAHIAEHPSFLQAYVVAEPDFPVDRWLCDVAQKTVSDRGPKPLDDKGRLQAVRAMNDWIENWMETVTSPVPATEKASWATKAAAARAYLDGTPTTLQSSMIATEAGLTGETEADLAAIIVARADQWQVVVSAVTGLRRKTNQRIEAATTFAEIDAILADAQAQAGALAEQMGV